MSKLTDLNDILYELYGDQCIVVNGDFTSNADHVQVSRKRYEAAVKLLRSSLSSTVRGWKPSIVSPPKRVSIGDLVCVCLASHEYSFNHLNVNWKDTSPSSYEIIWSRIERAAKADSDVSDLCYGRTAFGYTAKVCNDRSNIDLCSPDGDSAVRSLTKYLDKATLIEKDSLELDYYDSSDCCNDDFLRDYVPGAPGCLARGMEDEDGSGSEVLIFTRPELHTTYEMGLCSHLCAAGFKRC